MISSFIDSILLWKKVSSAMVTAIAVAAVEAGVVLCFCLFQCLAKVSLMKSSKLASLVL
jgi:hypothetical protein